MSGEVVAAADAVATESGGMPAADAVASEPGATGDPQAPAVAPPRARRRHLALPTEHSLLYYLGSAVSAAALIGVLAIAMIVIIIPKVSGGQALTVLTQSMEPGLPPGTLIVTRPTSADDIRVGQVITYQIESGKPEVVSHRVVTRTIASDGSTTFMTKGDNNSLADPNPVLPVQIQGVLWYDVPWIGYVNTWITGPSRGLVVPIVAVVLFGYAAFMGLSELRDRRKRKQGTRGKRSRSTAANAGDSRD